MTDEQNKEKDLDVSEVKRIIARFNSDENVRKLKDTFGHPSLFNIVNMSRNEKVHSALIAWLLRENPNGIALRGFLNIIARRSLKQGIDVPESFFTRTEHVIDSVETEHSIGKREHIIDIWVECSCGGEKYLVVIENKIYSPENGETNEQTTDYYAAIGDTYEERKVIYIFLKPMSDVELSGLEENGIWACSCHKFIQINYQDILDEILLPLLSDASVSESMKSRVREYVDCLSEYKELSSKNNDNKQHPKDSKAMAMNNETRELLKEFWNNNEKLIKVALQALSEDEDPECSDHAKEALNAISARDKTKYQFAFGNDSLSEPLDKVKLVCRVVREYVRKNSIVEASDLQKAFGNEIFCNKEYEKSEPVEGVRDTYLKKNIYTLKTKYFPKFLANCEKLGITIVS